MKQAPLIKIITKRIVIEEIFTLKMINKSIYILVIYKEQGLSPQKNDKKNNN